MKINRRDENQQPGVRDRKMGPRQLTWGRGMEEARDRGSQTSGLKTQLEIFPTLPRAL